MSLSSKPNYHRAGEILKESHFFSCQDQRIMLKSDNEEPLLSFSRLDHAGKIILSFANHDYDHNISFNCEHAIVKCNSWIQFSLFLKKLSFPFDYLILDRVDTWDSQRSKRDRGRIRSPIIAMMNSNRLKGTTVIMTQMGDDVGLEEKCHQVIQL